MRILVLGGTLFVGRYIVEAALANNHEVTIFNRGKTNPHLFPEIEKLRGDRDGNLKALQGRSWDTVIDVNGYVPRIVRDSVNLLKDHIEHYNFISTGAVYAFPFPTNGDENTNLKTVGDENTEDTDNFYGALKALCERDVLKLMPGRAMVQRLGLVAGPYDDSDRATYWMKRVAQGGEMLAPGQPDAAIQIVDARDLAAFAIRAAEEKITGIYNTTGESMSWLKWFETFRDVSGSEVQYTWIDDRKFLENIELRHPRPYSKLPLFFPEYWGDWWTANSDKAQAVGLRYRPMSEIARDVLEWEKTRPADYEWVAGLAPEDERAALALWHARG